MTNTNTTTQADLSRLRESGYGEPMTPLAETVAAYVRALQAEHDAPLRVPV